MPVQFAMEKPIESPEMPNPSTSYVKDVAFIEYFLKDGDFYMHIFKPVEKLIRDEEEKVRKTGVPPWPRIEEKYDIQVQLRKRLDKCDARRQIWKEAPMAAWPNIGEVLEKIVVDTISNNKNGSIEFIPEMDSWCIKLKKVKLFSAYTQQKLATAIIDRLKSLVKWPDEENV